MLDRYLILFYGGIIAFCLVREIARLINKIFNKGIKYEKTDKNNLPF